MSTTPISKRLSATLKALENINSAEASKLLGLYCKAGEELDVLPRALSYPVVRYEGAAFIEAVAKYAESAAEVHEGEARNTAFDDAIARLEGGVDEKTAVEIIVNYLPQAIEGRSSDELKRTSLIPEGFPEQFESLEQGVSMLEAFPTLLTGIELATFALS